MINRLLHIARSNFNYWREGGKPKNILEMGNESHPFSGSNGKFETLFEPAPDPLVQYYANLEIPSGSTLEEAKAAWRKLLKKYHPDLHSSDPEKREIAAELTRRLNEAYIAIEKEMKNKASTI